MKRPTVLFARLPRVVFMVGVAALLGSLAVSAHAQVTLDWVTAEVSLTVLSLTAVVG